MLPISSAVQVILPALAAIRSYQLGSLNVDIGLSPPQLAVSDRQGRLLMTTAFGQPFISASLGLTMFDTSSGNVQILNSTRSQKCATQTIASIEPRNPQLILSGGLFDGGPCNVNNNPITYTLSLTAIGTALDTLLLDLSVRGDVDQVYLSFFSGDEEAFLGLGAQTSWGDLRGKSIDLSIHVLSTIRPVV